MDGERTVRNQLIELLEGGHAHQSPERVLRAFPAPLINRHVPGVPYTAWRLLEHIRIAQWDILEFIRNPGHESPPRPEGYWSSEQPASEQEWREAVAQFEADLRALQQIARDPDADLVAPLPQGEDYTILREILTVADHTAYHLGQLVLLKRVLEGMGDEETVRRP